MQKVKKQHYVPQSYLRNYFYTDTSNYMLHVINKKGGPEAKDYNSTIDNICHRRFFYDCPLNLEDEQYIEKFFSREIEPHFSRVQKNIIQMVKNSLVAPAVSGSAIKIDKILFSVLLISQLYRTPRTYNKYLEEVPDMMEDLVKEFKINNQNSEVTDSDIEQAKIYVEELINKNWLWDTIIRYSNSAKGREKAHFLYNRNWLFFKLDIDIPLSEDIIIPVKWKNKKSGYYKVGIQEADVIYVQISKDIVLAMYHPLYSPHIFPAMDLG